MNGVLPIIHVIDFSDNFYVRQCLRRRGFHLPKFTYSVRRPACCSLIARNKYATLIVGNVGDAARCIISAVVNGCISINISSKHRPTHNTVKDCHYVPLQ